MERARLSEQGEGTVAFGTMGGKQRFRASEQGSAWCPGRHMEILGLNDTPPGQGHVGGSEPLPQALRGLQKGQEGGPLAQGS